MGPPLASLERSIAIHPEHIVPGPATFYVKQHNPVASGGSYTVRTCPSSSVRPAAEDTTKLFSVAGNAGSWRQRRRFADASGRPLFELYRKRAGVTWFIKPPGDTTAPIATLAPRWDFAKDKVDVHFRNAGADDGEMVLMVRGKNIYKVEVNVYHGETLVMRTTVLNSWAFYLPWQKPEWKVGVAEGMDLSLVSFLLSGVMLRRDVNN